jgi:hypothetical protein
MQTTTTRRPVPGAPPTEPPNHARRAGAPASGQRGPVFVFLPEDGIITVLLVAAVVYTTIASIQGVRPPWAPGMSILSPLSLVGMFLGLLAVQQRIVPNWIVHLVAVCFGCAAAFWMTARAVLAGDNRLLLVHLGTWLHQALHNQSSNDNTIFLLFLAALTYLLAYLSMWLVLHSRRPWLAVLANSVVLMINLNYAPPDQVVFLVIFLLAALLLLVRFTLAENVRVWRSRRLRFSPDLNWDFLQAGVIFAVVVLLLAYILPVGAANPAINAFVNNPSGALKGLEHRWEALFGSLNGPGGPGVGFFGGNLQLKGDVDLPTTEIFRYTSTDPSEYLITQTYDTYDGHGNWSQSLTQAHNYAAGAFYDPSSPVTRVISQSVDLTNYGNGQHNLFAAGEPASFDLPTSVAITTSGNIATAWYAQHELVTGETYGAYSYISNATIEQLRAVPLPTKAGPDAYPSPVLDLYLNNQDTIVAPEVAATAAQWTAGAKNPYDAAMDIEAQLHQGFIYSLHNGAIPPDQDAVVWFLHNKKGFCTFFASTMTLMMRSIGMPARIASGVTNGDFDAAHRNYVEKGTNLHVWTQVYFAGYGWINFEPTQSFIDFQRALPGSGTPTAVTPTQQGNGGGARLTPTPRFRAPTEVVGPLGATSPAGAAVREVALSLAFLIALALLVGSGFLVWWRALYRRLPPVEGAFARVARLGKWSGSPPRRDQTPFEYADALGRAVPAERDTFRRLSDLYVEERWGGTPAPADETTSLYHRARVALTRAIAHRWREVPRALLGWIAPLGERARRMRQALASRIDRLFEPPSNRW